MPFTLKQVEFVTSVYDLKRRPKDMLPEVAVAGRSNVGKSSLLNCLFQRKKLALTSKSPGKTRSLNYFKVNDRFYLVDLPGYGFAKAPKAVQQQWADLMAEYLEDNPLLRGAVQLIDSRHGITPLDEQMIAYFDAIELPYVIALTKTDKLSATRIQQVQKEVQRQLNHGQTGTSLRASSNRTSMLSGEDTRQHTKIIPFSAQTRQGKDQLWSAIQALLQQ